jgi:uncharacterized repeat protein (TIGR01451 family)
MTKIAKAAGTLLAAILVAAMPSAWAQKSAEPLESRLEARKVVVVDGKESFADANAARPGDVIEYLATYRNTGSGAITGLLATVPIPANTEYVPDSARPAGAQASLDGRTYAAVPLRRTVTRDGKRIEEQVPYREYRYLRWSAGTLGGGKTLAFTARVRVVDDRTPSEPGSKGGGR